MSKFKPGRITRLREFLSKPAPGFDEMSRGMGLTLLGTIAAGTIGLGVLRYQLDSSRSQMNTSDVSPVTQPSVDLPGR